MDKQQLIDKSYQVLDELLENGNFNAVKFVLESLEPSFNVDFQRLINILFKNIAEDIEKDKMIKEDDKLHIIDIINSNIEKIL